jgi:hypothetical protein
MEAVLQENNEVGAWYDGDDIFISSGGLVYGMKVLDETMLYCFLCSPRKAVVPRLVASLPQGRRA